jgi:carboxymethylenebutenolidase
MLHIAEADGFVPPPAQAAIREGLTGQPLATVHTYPGRDHAFARHGGEHYHAADAALAGSRSLAFLRTHLGSA